MKGLALLAAAGTSVLFGFGSVLQKAAAERVVAVRRLDARLLPRLLRQGHYLLGWICDTAGWVLQVAALTVLPLFVVQGFVVMGTGCTALLAWWLLGTRLSRRGWRALGLMLGAGVALALTAPADRPVRFGSQAWPSGRPSSGRCWPPAGCWPGIPAAGPAPGSGRSPGSASRWSLCSARPSHRCPAVPIGARRHLHVLVGRFVR